MENQKTEIVNIQDLMKSYGVTTEEKKVEIDGDKVLDKLIGVEPPNEEIVTLEQLATEKKEEVVVTKAETPKAHDTEYKKKLLELIELGLVKDYQVTVGEGEEAKELYFSDFDNIDKEDFDNILANYREIEAKELQEKYIPSEGLSDRAKKYLDIDKAGGDISQLIQEEKEYVNPILTYDLESEYGQEALVREDLRTQGIRPNVINATIADMKADFTLDTEAKKIAQTVTSNFDNYVENKRQEQLAQNEAEVNVQKELRKNLNSELKEFKNLNDAQRKVILDNATNINQYGITNTMQMYFDIEKDPKKYAELVVFMNNPEAYKDAVKVGVANKAKINTARHSFTINPRAVKQTVITPQVNTLGDEVFERLTQKHK